MKNYSLLVLIFCFQWSASLMADDEAVYTLPIEWQKVELQKQIENKLQQAFASIIPNINYILSVDISLSEAKAFGLTADKEGKNSQNFPLSKLGINKDSTAFKRALLSGINSIFTRINAVNVSLIVDATVSGNQETIAKNLINQTVKSYTGKAAGIRVSRTNLLPDTTLADDLKVAQVNVEAAKALAEAITQSNDKIANAIAATQGLKLPDDKPNQESVVNKKSSEELPKTWQEWVLVMRIPLGIVVATFLMLMGINGFKRFESQKVALMAQANAQASQANSQENEKEVVEEKAKETKSHDVSGLGLAAASGADTGFTQFKRMAEQYPETASYLVKMWLNMNTQETNEALAVLPKVIPVESLVGVFGGLEDSLKAKLKKVSTQTIDANSVLRADAFIVSQMVDTFLVNTIVLPDDLKMLLSEMTMEECVECYRRDNQLGTAFINVLQTVQLGRLLSLLSDEEVTSLFQEGLNFKGENVQYLSDNLPAMINKLRNEKQKVRVPLLDKAIDLIKELGPEKENQVFDMLVASGDRDQLREATQNFFPAQLIMSLPLDKIRSLINRFPTKERAVLIYSRPKDEQDLLLEAIGQSGRLRDIINTEIAEIQKDEVWKAKIIKDQSKIWQKFVILSRETLLRDESIRQSADELLAKWLLEKGVEYSKGGDDEIAAA